MEGSGSEIAGSAKGKSKVFMASFISLILGLVVYAAGFLMYSYYWHRYYYEGFGQGNSSMMGDWYRMMEWGNWAKGAGIMLVILGVALIALGIMRWDRKQVHP